MGKDEQGFAELVSEIIQRHVGKLEETAFVSRLSEGGKYISITITFIAQSKEQLDALYEELSRHEKVLMIL
jgi:putative lipoic acid-binding regulatory protein